MSTVLHLLKHDIGTHRRLLLAWIAIVSAHPLVAAIRWSEDASLRLAIVPGLLLVGARIALGAVLIATVVQADSPIEDRAFWRTRPIRPRTMAVAKLVLAWSVFVLVPLAVVCAVAAVLGVPWRHWPSTVTQVVFTEGALVGLLLVLSTRTRRVPTLLLGAVASTGLLSVLTAALQDLRRVPWFRDRDVLADPQIAVAAMLALASLGFASLFLLGYEGQQRRRSFGIGALGIVLVLVGCWFVPGLRAARPQPLPLGLTLTDRAIAAEYLSTRNETVGIVVEPTVTGLRGHDTVKGFLLDGTLTWSGGSRPARGAADPRSVVASDARPQAPLLAVLSTHDFAAVAGQRVRFAGRFNVQVERTEVVATTRLAPGDTIGTDHVLLRLQRIAARPDEGTRRPLVDGLELLLRVPGAWHPGHEYVLRDSRTGCETPAYPWSRADSPGMAVALLPTLARPFYARRVTLTAHLRSNCDPDLSHVVLELRKRMRPPPTAVPVDLEFTVPLQAQPARAAQRTR